MTTTRPHDAKAWCLWGHFSKSFGNLTVCFRMRVVLHSLTRRHKYCLLRNISAKNVNSFLRSNSSDHSAHLCALVELSYALFLQESPHLCALVELSCALFPQESPHLCAPVELSCALFPQESPVVLRPLPDQL